MLTGYLNEIGRLNEMSTLNCSWRDETGSVVALIMTIISHPLTTIDTTAHTLVHQATSILCFNKVESLEQYHQISHTSVLPITESAPGSGGA